MVNKSPGRPKKFGKSQTMAVQLESCIYFTLDKMSHDYSIKEGKLVSKGDLIRDAVKSFIENEFKAAKDGRNG